MSPIYGHTEPPSPAFPKGYDLREAFGRWVANGSPSIYGIDWPNVTFATSN